IWSSASCPAVPLEGHIYSQPSFSVDINSPMLCSGPKNLQPKDVLPTLQVSSCVEADPSIAVVRSGYLLKKGKEVLSMKQKRRCVLTTQKELLYFDGTECKSFENQSFAAFRRFIFILLL